MSFIATFITVSLLVKFRILIICLSLLNSSTKWIYQFLLSIVNPYWTFRIIISLFTLHFFIMRSLYSKKTRVKKYRVITYTSLKENNNSRSTVSDRYSRTRMWNTLDSLIMLIQAFDLPSYWYNLSSYNDGFFCKLLLLEECIFIYILLKYELIRQQVVSSDMTTTIVCDK